MINEIKIEERNRQWEVSQLQTDKEKAVAETSSASCLPPQDSSFILELLKSQGQELSFHQCAEYPCLACLWGMGIAA